MWEEQDFNCFPMYDSDAVWYGESEGAAELVGSGQVWSYPGSNFIIMVKYWVTITVFVYGYGIAGLSSCWVLLTSHALNHGILATPYHSHGDNVTVWPGAGGFLWQARL